MDVGDNRTAPRVIGNDYTFSTYEGAALAQLITPWVGSCPDNFDFESLIGKACYLAIVHKESASSGNSYAKIASAMKVPDGVSIPQQENDTIFYDMEAMGKDYPLSLMTDSYKWLREKIQESQEFVNPHQDEAQTTAGITPEQKQRYDEAIGGREVAKAEAEAQDSGAAGDIDPNIPF